MIGQPTEIELGILGPLEVRVAGRPRPVPGARQRALLAALLLRRGHVVPMDRLVDEVFGEAPPREARNALQTYVTRLRQALGPVASVIATRAPGYVLQVPSDAVDADRFAALIGQARATEAPPAALALLERALALWRGPAYAEFASTFARGEALRLSELRLAAEEDRAVLLLRLDRAAEATAVLEAIAAREPWRERAVELLVTALARAGRAGDALAAFASYRDRLRDELGLDPSPKLRRVEEQVLRGTLAPLPSGPDRRVPDARPTSFVGRERELALVRKAIAAAPLVTLVGPGGVGKTRLAQEVGDRQDPVWWVDLAPLRDPTAVADVVAGAVGIDILPGTPLSDALRQWSRRARGLLVLDNCEHLLAAVAQLAGELLATASGLSLLATSRERLAIGGEQVLDVPPLALPPADAPEGPAVRLFLDRAQAADPAVATSPLPPGRVADICRALDGLPLAIELAAARIGTMTVDDLADRLDTRFELLRSGRRDGDSRHQALEAVVDWSFELLGADEQRLFLRLSVFAAAFDIAAAETVAADDDVPAGRVADLVARLAEQSMLTRPGPSGIGRYRMLETLRAYAVTRLPDVEAERLRRRHITLMVDLAERAEAGLYGPEEAAWAHRIEFWLDDLRAAWTWARDADEVDLAVRLAAALTRYAYWRLRSDLLAWGTWVAATVPAHPRLPVAFAAAAADAWADGRLLEARDLARRGVEAAGGPMAPAAAAPLEALGDVAMLAGDLATSLEAYRGVAALAAPGDPAGLAVATANLALTRAYAGDDQAACPAAEEAVAAALASANPTAMAMARFAEGEAFADADPARASASLDEARRRAREVGNRFVAGTALTAKVALRGRHGPPEEALALFRDAIDHWRTSANRALLVTTLRNLVVLLARTGRDEAAAALAATLQEAAPSRSYGVEAARIVTALAAVRRRLGDAAYDGAWRAGAARTLEEAADDAMQVLVQGPGSA
ncbi:MAG TPA: BTAD domain-containing putative transcriptional regulator [Actinomycetota bacterium]|nr:BTAD domain-containing putative transcriptional regulator [Actinomycetota bacterium]